MKSVIFFLMVVCVFGSCDKVDKNTMSITFNHPTANLVVVDPSNVAIDFEVRATIKLTNFDIYIWDGNGAGPATIAPYNPMVISPSGTSYRYQGSIDLSSYPPGSKFTLSVSNNEVVQRDNPSGLMQQVNFSI